MPADATDAELLERWSAGDRAAGNDLFERYIKRLFRFFKNKVQLGMAVVTPVTFHSAICNW